MRKLYVSFSLCLVLLLVASASCFADGASGQSQRSANQSAQAASNAAAASGHAVAGSGQVASGASAIPLMVGGASGQVSGAMGADLSKAANSPIGEPLPLTDDVITAGPPPNEAINQ